MKRIIITAAVLVVAASNAQQAFAHCEVPCGIYADQRRFEQMLEDQETIQKAMVSINELAAKSDALSKNQLTRWVVTKEELRAGMVTKEQLRAGMVTKEHLRAGMVTKGQLRAGVTFGAPKAYVEPHAGNFWRSKSIFRATCR